MPYLDFLRGSGLRLAAGTPGVDRRCNSQFPWRCLYKGCGETASSASFCTSLFWFSSSFTNHGCSPTWSNTLILCCLLCFTGPVPVWMQVSLYIFIPDLIYIVAFHQLTSTLDYRWPRCHVWYPGQRLLACTICLSKCNYSRSRCCHLWIGCLGHILSYKLVHGSFGSQSYNSDRFSHFHCGRHSSDCLFSHGATYDWSSRRWFWHWFPQHRIASLHRGTEQSSQRKFFFSFFADFADLSFLVLTLTNAISVVELQ